MIPIVTSVTTQAFIIWSKQWLLQGCYSIVTNVTAPDRERKISYIIVTNVADCY
jgi:hypothetical protein